MPRPWIFLINPFEVATEKSYRTAKKLGDYTTAALGAQSKPRFVDMFNEISPLSADFNNAYSTWTSQLGSQKGNSSSLATLLKQLSSQKIEDWDIAIQQVYKQNTPQYISLLPNRRKPFQNGTQETRINAVKSLSESIGTDEALATVKTDVDDFFTSITLVYTTQKGSISKSGNSSTNVELARKALCTGLYGILGQLMDYFKETPDAVSSFIDIETLRNLEQSVYKSNIKGGETLLVLTHTFEAGEKARFVNRGNTDLAFALVAEKKDAMPSAFVTITANNELITDASALGDIAANRFLIAKNLSATGQGAYTVQLL